MRARLHHPSPPPPRRLLSFPSSSSRPSSSPTPLPPPRVYGDFTPPPRGPTRKQLTDEEEELRTRVDDRYTSYLSLHFPPSPAYLSTFSSSSSPPPPSPFPSKKAKELFPEELETRMRGHEFWNRYMIVDCRSEEEFRVGTIEGAIHISKLESRFVCEKLDLDLDEEGEYVESIVCIDTIGLRSATWCLKLESRQLHYKAIYNLRGGLLTWTLIGGKIHVPPPEDELEIYGTFGWAESSELHVAIPHWSLQHPSITPRYFVDGKGGGEGGGGGGGTYSIPFLTYSLLRDFWFYMPLSFWRGLMNGGGGGGRRRKMVEEMKRWTGEEEEEEDGEEEHPGGGLFPLKRLLLEHKKEKNEGRMRKEEGMQEELK